MTEGAGRIKFRLFNVLIAVVIQNTFESSFKDSELPHQVKCVFRLCSAKWTSFHFRHLGHLHFLYASELSLLRLSLTGIERAKCEALLCANHRLARICEVRKAISFPRGEELQKLRSRSTFAIAESSWTFFKRVLPELKREHISFN